MKALGIRDRTESKKGIIREINNLENRRSIDGITLSYDIIFSSKSTEWETPKDLFDKLNEEFDFILDPCSTIKNKKCDHFFTIEQDGLKQDWSKYKRVFMNPPYGKEITKWVKKAYEESIKGCIVVCLLPARTDTKWFHTYVYGKAELRFLDKRLRFSGSKQPAPFPSVIAIFIKERII